MQNLWHSIALKKNAAAGSPKSHAQIRERLDKLESMILDRDDRLVEFKLDSEDVEAQLTDESGRLEHVERELEAMNNDMMMIEGRLTKHQNKLKAEKKKKMKLTMKLAAVVGKKQKEAEMISKGQLDGRAVLTLTRELDVSGTPSQPGGHSLRSSPLPFCSAKLDSNRVSLTSGQGGGEADRGNRSEAGDGRVRAEHRRICIY